jgi:superfamily II DNA/RNA helicase
LRQSASPEEEAAYESLLAIPFTQKGRRQGGRHQELQRVGMQKSIFSSPAAALKSTRQRIQLLESKDGGPNPEEAAEITALQVFAETLEKIDATSFSKFQRLVTQLRDPSYGWKPSDPSDRLVIFSERIETLEWLLATMPGTLGMKGDQFQILHGGMSDTEQQDIVERFGRKDDAMRVLLCSDVASEGLNLHYFCHRLIHFDLPWSLMVFQQRNGRVDRYGQRHQPRITYLFTETTVERIKGDLRILEILQTKDEQANKNLGDPASFLHVYDPEKEAAKVEEAMAAHVAPEIFEKELDENAARSEEPPSDDEDDAGEWLMSLFAANDDKPLPCSTSFIEEPPSLFGDDRPQSDYAFAKTALQQLSIPDPIAQFSVDDLHQTVTLTAPADLQDRLKLGMPAEARDKGHRYTLTASNLAMAEAIERARQAKREEESWPAIHYLWPQHPIMEWLTERVLTAFGRHRAPVIRLPHLAEGEQAFILLSLIPNRKGQPLLIEWRVAVQREGKWELEAFPDFATRTKLSAGQLPNSGVAIDTTSLQRNLPAAVTAMRKFMVERQKTFAANMDARLETTLADLARLQGKQLEQLEWNFAKSQLAENLKRGQREQRTQHIRKVFDEYRDWVRDTMTTEPEPFIQVLAAAIR